MKNCLNTLKCQIHGNLQVKTWNFEVLIVEWDLADQPFFNQSVAIVTLQTDIYHKKLERLRGVWDNKP